MNDFFAALASIGAAAFGLLALSTDFSPDKITKRAVVIMVGIAASAILAFVTTTVASREQGYLSASRHTKLLKRLREESISVDLARIRAVIRCNYVGLSQDGLPTENWKFGLRAKEKPQEKTGRTQYSWNRWFGASQFKSPDLELEANSQEVNKRVWRTVDDEQWEQILLLGGFTGRLGGMSEGLSWNAAKIDAAYVALRPAKGTWLKPAVTSAHLQLFVGDRMVAKATGPVETEQTWDEDVRGAITIRFPTMTVPEDCFLPFGLEDQDGGRAVVVGRLLAWFLSIVVIACLVLVLMSRSKTASGKEAPDIEADEST